MLRKAVCKIVAEECVFMECDIQEKMRNHAKSFETVVHNARRMAMTAKIFNIPIISTKHIRIGDHAKGLADEHFDLVKVFEKHEMSMITKPELFDHLKSL